MRQVPEFQPRSRWILTFLLTLATTALQAATATIDPTKSYQTMEGFGGATAFYAGWITAHPYKQEIYSNAFAGLNLSMLRLGDWYRYQTPLKGFDSAATEIVSNANRVLGHPVPVYMSSWAPPAFLKSNLQVGNGGTLIMTNGGFAYTNFAQYWYDSIRAYQSNGVNLTWASLQNEPDWVAGYDSCIFNPSEGVVNGTNYASYSKALDAVYQQLTNLPSPPKLLAPEPTHSAYNDLQNYGATLHSGSFYGIAYHLYGGSTDGTADGYKNDLTASSAVFPDKPHFMTEFGYPDMMSTACLIHDCITIGQDVGFNYWSLVWPVGGDALINQENPYVNQSTWTNAPAGVTTQKHGWWLTPAYWAMKHYSYFIQPGFVRVGASDNDSNVRCSAYRSPDGLRLVVVLINTNPTVSSAMNFSFGIFNPGHSNVYQTAGTNTYAGTNTFLSLGALTNGQVLPPYSLTTIVLDQTVTVGAASNPSPTNGATGVPLSSALSWTPGSNAVAHAIYLGTDSNAVAQATTTSPLFLGTTAATNAYPPLLGSTTYFWRVDESIGANTSASTVWTFTTGPAPDLIHRYSFSETGGTNVLDSNGGPAWAGALPAGGTLASGQLSLASASQQYAALPAGLVGSLTNFTIEVWVRLTSIASWNRIFDFGDNTTTYMFLTPQNGSTTVARYAITVGGAGGEQTINGTSALSIGPWHLVAVTWKNNIGILYVDGAAVGTNSAMTLNPASLGNTSNNYLGKSQYADPYLNGSFDEFRIYQVALSAPEIAATYALGASQLLSTNPPTTTLYPAGNNFTMSWPGGSAGFTVQESTNLASGLWTTVPAASPALSGTNWRVTLPATNTTLYFRLLK
jgi:O-glycosyl hydrolase